VKKFIFSSLKSRLYMLVLISILPVCMLILYTAFEQRRSELKKIEQSTLKFVEAAAIEETQILEGARQILIVLGSFLRSEKFDPSSCGLFFSETLEQFTRYANLGAVHPDGSVFCSAKPLKQPLTAKDREWFTQALKSLDFSVGQFSIGRITGKPVLVMSYPVLDSNQQAALVVFAALDMNWLNRFTSHASIQVPKGSTLSQMDVTGVLITYQPDTRTWVEGSFSDRQLYQSVSNNKRGIIESRDKNGNSLIYAFAPLKSSYLDREVTFILSVPSAIVYADSNRTLLYNLILVAAVFALAMVVARFASRYFILRDIETLIRAKEMLAKGDLSTRIDTIQNETGVSDIRGFGFPE